jgi:aspartate aminotransferase
MYLLEEAQVACVSGEAFGTPNCLRISYAASEEKLKLAAGKIKEACNLLK